MALKYVIKKAVFGFLCLFQQKSDLMFPNGSVSFRRVLWPLTGILSL